VNERFCPRCQTPVQPGGKVCERCEQPIDGPSYAVRYNPAGLHRRLAAGAETLVHVG
jgi:predicted amidophosphoribosyltransferase